MTTENLTHPPLSHLVACVTFFYRPERLPYLAKVISNYIDLANRVDIYIVTNVADSASRNQIAQVLPILPEHVSITFRTPSGIGHPYLLTWAHREIFHEVLKLDDVSHFLYSEDDIDFSRANVIYWLRYRESLREYGLIPSFFRVEMHPQKGWCSTDYADPIVLSKRPNITLGDGMLFFCAPHPYQGMYFLDRELMEEFASSPALSPDFGAWSIGYGTWGIREKATSGVTFVNIPWGFTSRNVVPFCSRTKSIPQECWVHHLPNNYTNDENSIYGNLSVQGNDLFVTYLQAIWLSIILKILPRVIKKFNHIKWILLKSS